MGKLCPAPRCDANAKLRQKHRRLEGTFSLKHSVKIIFALVQLDCHRGFIDLPRQTHSPFVGETREADRQAPTNPSLLMICHAQNNNFDYLLARLSG